MLDLRLVAADGTGVEGCIRDPIVPSDTAS